MGFLDRFRKKPNSQPDIPKVTNQLISRLLYQFQYGRELVSENDLESQLRAYRSWVFVASSLNASSVSQVPLRLYVAKPKKNSKSRFATREVTREQKEYLYKHCRIWKYDCVRKSADIEEVLEHPIFDLFKNVNNFNNSFDLWEMTDLHQELTGNAYWYLVGGKGYNVPLEIWTIPPQRLAPIPDPRKFISAYKYTYSQSSYEFDESEVIHFKFPNPYNMYVGISPLVAVASAYTINENMSKYEQAIFQNMGKLSGAFTTKESIDEEDWKRLKQELQEAYGGMDNAGKTALLDKGLEYKDFGMTPTDLSFIDGRKLVREEILNCFGQNLALYSENANRANSDAAERAFMRRTIRPRCIRIAEKLNEKLCPRYDDTIFVAFDDPSPEDILTRARVAEISLRMGRSTINEERLKERQPPIDGGDEPMIQSQYIPLSLAASGAALRQGSPENQGQPREGRPNEPKTTISQATKIIADAIRRRLNDEN